MIVHLQKNHTYEEHKASEYLAVSPKKGWEHDTIIARDTSQVFLGNIIGNIGQTGSKNLGKQNIDMRGYFGGQFSIANYWDTLKRMREDSNISKSLEDILSLQEIDRNKNIEEERTYLIDKAPAAA